MGRLLLGSVADEVLHESTVPVLIVPPDASGSMPKLDTILVPLDGSPLAEEAVPVAQKLAKDRSRVVLFRAVAPVEGLVNAGGFTELKLDESATQAEEANADSYLAGLCKRLQSEGTQTARLVLRGKPAEQIRSATRAASSDVIVMTSHGYSGLRRLRLGSVADEVVRRVDNPILLITSRMLAARLTPPRPVTDIMTRPSVALRADEPLQDAYRRIVGSRSPVIPVVDSDGTLLGTLSARDLLNRQVELARGDAVGPGDTDTVAELMVGEAITIDVSASILTAAETLIRYRLDGLTVVQDGRPVGVVTLGDLLEAVWPRTRGNVERE